MQALIGMHEIFSGRETRAKLDADKRKQLAARAAEEVSASAGAGGSGAATSAYTKANSAYIGDHRQAQQQMVREQNTQLDTMSSSLDQLNMMAGTIKDELEDQEKILTDVESGIDTAQSKMDSVTKHIEKLLKTKDKCQIMTICLLVLLFVVVAGVAFYVLTG